MSNAVAVQTEKVTESLLRDYLASTTKGLTEEQRAQFIAIATAFNLNPFKREVYATTYKNKDGSTQMSVVTGYEVYLKRAEMNPNYDGFECNIHGGFKMAQGQYGPMLVPNGEVFAECKVYRKDRKMPVQEVVYFDEFKQNNKMWKEKPRLMLRKVAIANAFRKAFPLDFGGMPYTNDELPDEMTRPQEVHAEVVEDVPAITPDEPTRPQEVHAEVVEDLPAITPDEPTKQITRPPKQDFSDVVRTEVAKVGNSQLLTDLLKEGGYEKPEDVPKGHQKDFYLTLKDRIAQFKECSEQINKIGDDVPEAARNDYQQAEADLPY